MAGRSMAVQIAQIQKEVTPGTAVTNAMLRPASLRLRPGVHVEGGSSFTAAGANAPTAYMGGDEWGVWGVEGIQDYNTLGFIAESTLGASTTGAVADSAYTHVWTPKDFGADVYATYTAQFGDSTIGVQGAQMVFNSLGINIQRGTLGITSGAVSRKLDFGATMASAGVTTVAAVPIHPTSYNVYADDTWATLGNTKLLACYEFNVTNPDKYVPDSPINAAIDGFDQLIQADGREFTVDISVALDAAGTGLVANNFRANTLKFFRIETEGALIGVTSRYKLTYDLAVQITSVGEVTAQSGSNVATLPMTGQLIIDPTSGKYQELTIINKLAGY